MKKSSPFQLFIAIFSLLISLGIFGLFEGAGAAELNLQFNPETPSAGEEVSAVVKLDTQGQEINALEGSLVFPVEALELVDLSEGSSIINFWVDSPSLSAPGEIFFSGIIPGGYDGQQGNLFTVRFRTLNPATAEFRLEEGQALLNDGQASQAGLSALPSRLEIGAASSVPASVYERPKDDEAPEEFSIYLSRDANLFSGDWFIAFSTQDKKSGLAGYFVQELRPGKKGKEFVPASSPYRLSDQSLRSDIYVKALDKAGNERLAYLPAQASGGEKASFVWLRGAALFFLLLIAIMFLWLWLRRKTK